MRTTALSTTMILFALLLSGCETMPEGPSVAVMPTQGKPFDLFQQEDQMCRNYAAQSLGPNAATAGNQSIVNGAAVGTVLGAVVGGLAGGRNGAAGGAAIGLGMGTAVGAQNALYAGYSLQQRYDIAYEQCMYAKGNKIQAPRVRVYQGYGPGYYRY